MSLSSVRSLLVVATITLVALSGTAPRDAQAQVDRSTPPVLGPPPALHFPPVTVRELANGLKLMIVERHDLPVAEFVLVIPSGATANATNRAGAANLVAAMLTEGTSTRTSLQIADQAAYLGISLRSSSGWDATTVDLSTPTAQLDSALALFADIALHPSFPAAEFARVKQERLTSLLQLKDQGPAVASLVYPVLLYGKDSPYGRSPIGTDASVEATTVADLSAFYASHFAPNGATLIAVGDIMPTALEVKMNALFGHWARATAPAVSVGAAQKPLVTTIYMIDKPDAAQSSFRLGSAGPPRTTSDYFPILVTNTTLGGSFTSRLNQDLREDKGYTYGAYSQFDMRKDGGPFTASAEVVSTKSDSALVEFLKQLKAIRDTIPVAELTKAKRYLQLELPSEFETIGQIATGLSNVALYGLPLDYYNRVVSDIGNVTQAEAQHAAEKYIDLSHLTVLIVGDRRTIEGPVRALNIGPLLFRDSNGDPVQ